MQHLKKNEWIILSGLLLLSFVPSAGGVFRLVELGVGSEFLPENPRIQSAPIPFVLHIVTSVIYCLVGAFQFLPSFRRSYPNWHRIAGSLLISAGTISALTALWMTHYFTFSTDLQGSLLYFVRIVVGFAMLTFIFMGLAAALRKNFSDHFAFMLRAYAVGQGAGMQVLITIPFLLTIGEPIGFARDVLMTLGWVINLLIVERIITNRKTMSGKASDIKAVSFNS